MSFPYVKVKKTEIDKTEVSTIAIHDMFGGQIMYETMIFDHPRLEGETWRCDTEKEALANHTQAVILVKGWNEIKERHNV